MKNILITPAPTGTTNPSIAFSGATAKMITLEVLSGGTLAFNSSGGTMLSIDDTTTGSLYSVNDISGLPILEVFSDDRVVAGKFNTNAFVVSGTNVGFGTATPSVRVDIKGYGADSNTIFTLSNSAGTPFFLILNTGDTTINSSFKVTGNTSVNVLSASTIYSGSTNLESMFLMSSALSGIGTITASVTAPASPSVGDLWIDIS